MKTKKRMLLSMVTVFALSGALPQHGLAGGPATVELDSLSDLYEPVSFDHAMHVELTESNCAVCHHHTTGTPPVNENCNRCHANSGEADVAACRDCHAEKRFEAAYLAKVAENPQLYHIDKPGLKGAYHQNCMGCHAEMGAPTGCSDCHPRKEKGDAYFHAGQYAPQHGKGPSGAGH